MVSLVTTWVPQLHGSLPPQLNHRRVPGSQRVKQFPHWFSSLPKSSQESGSQDLNLSFLSQIPRFVIISCGSLDLPWKVHFHGKRKKEREGELVFLKSLALSSKCCCKPEHVCNKTVSPSPMGPRLPVAVCLHLRVVYWASIKKRNSTCFSKAPKCHMGLICCPIRLVRNCDGAMKFKSLLPFLEDFLEYQKFHLFYGSH